MTARLSPAQQRVVDQMRDGAKLRLDCYTGTFFLRPLANRSSNKVTPSARALIRIGAVQPSLASGPPEDPHTVWHVLAAAYQGGES